MICRRCGNRIPESLAALESFQCPNCGRQFGRPEEYDAPRTRPAAHDYSYDDDPAYDDRYDDRYADDPAYDDHYDDRYADDPAYDDRYDDRYADDPAYDDHYDDRYADDPAYDDRYDDRFPGGEPDPSGDFLPDGGQRRAAGMPLAVVLYAVTAALLVLAVVLCISVARSRLGAPSQAPAAATIQPSAAPAADDLAAPDAAAAAASGDDPTV